MCKFCDSFNFESAGAYIDGYNRSHIELCGGNGKIEEEKQFSYCPVCGEKVIPFRKDPKSIVESLKICLGDGLCSDCKYSKINCGDCADSLRLDSMKMIIKLANLEEECE